MPERPLAGSSLDQHKPRCGPGFAHCIKELANGMRGIRILGPIPFVSYRLNDLHAIPLSIQFIRQNTRQSGAAPIPHFGTVRNDINHPIRLYTNKYIRMKNRMIDGSLCPRGCPHDARGNISTQHKSSS